MINNKNPTAPCSANVQESIFYGTTPGPISPPYVTLPI